MKERQVHTAIRMNLKHLMLREEKSQTLDLVSLMSLDTKKVEGGRKTRTRFLWKSCLLNFLLGEPHT